MAENENSQALAKKTTTKPAATKRTVQTAKAKNTPVTIAVYEEPAADATEQPAAPEPVVTTKPAEAKPTRTRKPKPTENTEPKKLSALNAAAQLLTETKQPMNAMEMIDARAGKGLWTSPVGATPHATLYTPILREIAAKGTEARFKKAGRGKFEFNG